MRFIKIEDIEVGMTLGKTIYNNEGANALTEGHVLTPHYIKGIKELGYNGLYINTGSSASGEKVKSVIKESLKVSTTQSVKTFFKVASHNDMDDEVFQELQRKIIAVVDNILENETVLYNLVDLKIYDDYTYQHSVNVTILSLVIGINYGLGNRELKELALASIIHDIGKVFIPNDILNKRASLTGREFETMKQHVIEGSKFVSTKLNVGKEVYLGMVEHHERWDGTGYPFGRKEHEISLYGRMIAIADVYDALSSDRPYRRGLSPSDSFEYIIAHSGNHFDPELIQIFFNNVAPYPVGTDVILSNGEEGYVSSIQKKFLMRPDVCIGDKVISLKDNKSYRNVTIIDKKEAH